MSSSWLMISVLGSWTEYAGLYCAADLSYEATNEATDGRRTPGDAWVTSAPVKCVRGWMLKSLLRTFCCRRKYAALPTTIVSPFVSHSQPGIWILGTVLTPPSLGLILLRMIYGSEKQRKERVEFRDLLCYNIIDVLISWASNFLQLAYTL